MGPSGPGKQIHDFNPGIAKNGLFWTTRVRDATVQVNDDHDRAILDVSGLDIEDYGDVVNALQEGPSVPATVSFVVRWHDEIKRYFLRDVTNRFLGHFVQTDASIRWSAREEGFRFVSDPADTSTASFAVLGFERNGKFFE